MPHLVIDGMNVIGARPDGWWRDRAGATRRLLTWLQALRRFAGEPVTVVLDGRPLPDVPEGVHDGVHVLYARRGGRDAADDRLVEFVRDLDDRDDVVVVTSDRGLRARVHELDTTVVGAGTLLARLDPKPDTM